jgi:hypothetical protein
MPAEIGLGFPDPPGVVVGEPLPGPVCGALGLGTPGAVGGKVSVPGAGLFGSYGVTCNGVAIYKYLY